MVWMAKCQWNYISWLCMLSVNDLLISSGCTMSGFSVHGSSVQFYKARLCPTVFDFGGKTVYKWRHESCGVLLSNYVLELLVLQYLYPPSLVLPAEEHCGCHGVMVTVTSKFFKYSSELLKVLWKVLLFALPNLVVMHVHYNEIERKYLAWPTCSCLGHTPKCIFEKSHQIDVKLELQPKWMFSQA